MSQFRVFAEYVVPSVLAYALAGVYAIVDGFFVGHSMGDAGLSAIVIDLKTVAVTRCQQIRFDREHFLPCINAIFQLFPWFIVCG